MIRTLVSATSELARAGLGAIVRGDARLEFAGDTTPAELATRIAALEPDVLLEDGDGGGGDTHLPSVALVDDPRTAWTRALAMGDDERPPFAIVARDAPAEEIGAALVAVAAGLVAVTPSALAIASRTANARGAERLTAREIDVLGELARGAANKTIGARLSISEHTVKFHIASIFAKLGAASRTEAVTRGVRLGLIML